MEVEVLLSTMHQNDLSVAERCNIKTSCVIVNQCNRTNYLEKISDSGSIRMFSTTERGLSKSRNLALSKSKGEICLLCDDDVCYREGYEQTVKKAFCEIPDADVIVFNINSLNPEIRPQEKLFNKVHRVSRFKTYSSVHIAFRRKNIISKNIEFDERFGSGSDLYSMGEDSLFFIQIHKKGLKAYAYPSIIADLSSNTSTWFRGYDRKYFLDVGAYLSAAYPLTKHIMKFYYPLRFINLTSLMPMEVLKCINIGIYEYKQKNM